MPRFTPRGLVIAAVLTILVVSIPLVLYLVNQQQSIKSSAQEGGSCTTPSQVENVRIEFPNCEGANCSFSQASCSWDTVAGATGYDLVVTQVESGSVAKQERINSSTLRTVFAVEANKTYRCSVAAVNSCGTAGAEGTYELLCSVELQATTAPTAPPVTTAPTPTLKPGVTAPPAPTTPPVVVAPTIAKIACGYSPCTTDASCESGLVCVRGTNGQGYCGKPEYQKACAYGQSISTCCEAAPTSAPAPTMVPTGDNTPMVLGAGLATLVSIGIAAFFFAL